MTVAFDKAATFLALVGGAGYAGMFAIWGWVAPYLSRRETLAAGALLGFSLLMFIVWQLYGQFTLARQQMEFGRLVAVEDKDLEAALAMFKVNNRSMMLRLTKIWRPALTVVAVPGVMGGLVIVAASVRHLICPD